MKLMKIFDNEDEIIKLRDGYNIKTIMFSILAIILFIVLATSKMWLPDGRRNATVLRDDSNFNNVTVGIINDSFNIDFDTQVGEIAFLEMKFPNREVEEITYTIYDENETKLPLNVIKGGEVKDGMIINTDILIQFGVPKDVYYVRVVISQDNLNYSYTIDYRDFEETTVIERDDDYLININRLEKKLQELNTKLENIEEKIEKEEDGEKKETLEQEREVVKQSIKVQTEVIKQYKGGTYILDKEEVTEEDKQEAQEENQEEPQEETEEEAVLHEETEEE